MECIVNGHSGSDVNVTYVKMLLSNFAESLSDKC